MSVEAWNTTNNNAATCVAQAGTSAALLATMQRAAGGCFLAADLARQQDVLPRLRHRPIGGRHDKDGAVHLQGAGGGDRHSAASINPQLGGQNHGALQAHQYATLATAPQATQTAVQTTQHSTPHSTARPAAAAAHAAPPHRPPPHTHTHTCAAPVIMFFT